MLSVFYSYNTGEVFQSMCLTVCSSDKTSKEQTVITHILGLKRLSTGTLVWMVLDYWLEESFDDDEFVQNIRLETQLEILCNFSIWQDHRLCPSSNEKSHPQAPLLTEAGGSISCSGENVVKLEQAAYLKT